MKPILSLLICSRAKQLPDRFLQNIDKTIGCTYELIVIDNSENKYSIFEAYQTAYEKSSGNYLAYLHDDIYFHTTNWGLLLVEHLSVPGVGICGIGGRDTLVRVPSSWKVSLPYIHIIQSDKNGTNRRIKSRPSNFNGKRIPVIMLDGVVLCMPRRVMEHVAFDTSLGGFHAYDFDICIRSASAGFQNYVMYNIDIEHFSRGKADRLYYRNLIQVFQNHTKNLPLSTKPIAENGYRQLEKEGLNRLVRKMASKGFVYDEIETTYTFFLRILRSKELNHNDSFSLETRWLKIKIFLIQLFYRL